MTTKRFDSLWLRALQFKISLCQFGSNSTCQCDFIKTLLLHDKMYYYLLLSPNNLQLLLLLLWLQCSDVNWRYVYIVKAAHCFFFRFNLFSVCSFYTCLNIDFCSDAFQATQFFIFFFLSFPFSFNENIQYFWLIVLSKCKLI